MTDVSKFREIQKVSPVFSEIKQNSKGTARSNHAGENCLTLLDRTKWVWGGLTHVHVYIVSEPIKNDSYASEIACDS